MLLASLLLLVYLMLTMFLLLTMFLWLTIFLLFQISAVAGGPIKLLDQSIQTGNFFCYWIEIFLQLYIRFFFSNLKSFILLELYMLNLTSTL
jgi:hypothetical protein